MPQQNMVSSVPEAPAPVTTVSDTVTENSPDAQVTQRIKHVYAH